MGILLDLGNGNKIDSDKFANDCGIHIPDLQGMIPSQFRRNYALACDAQPSLVTVSNAGIPSYMTNFITPDFVQVAYTPMKAAQIVGTERRFGTWEGTTITVPVLENTGEVSSYGDFNENGNAGVNANFVQRDAYLYETITQWGELELDRAGAARIDLAARKNESALLVLNKFQNKSYFFGVSGLRNYGLLNDPALIAAISPAVGVWTNQDASAIYTDIQRLYKQLIVQTKGILDSNSPMTLAMSPTAATNLTKTNIYNVNVTDQIKKNFPNLRIETAPEYATTGGELVQLIADSLDGQETAVCAFNEKLRAHPVVIGVSNYKQKKTGGTFGTIIKQPTAIAQLLGV